MNKNYVVMVGEVVKEIDSYWIDYHEYSGIHHKEWKCAKDELRKACNIDHKHYSYIKVKEGE